MSELGRKGFGSGRLAGWGFLLAVLAATVPARAGSPIDQEPINYSSAPSVDPVARLQARIDRGEVELKHDEEQGYLRSVLEYLEVPPSSQGLVFSKTSFQHTRISPRMPRAIYFGDDVYVGWVRGGDVLEFAAVDPQLGPVFYLLDQTPSRKPTFRRETYDCLQCHHSPKTQDVPGVMVRSLFPDRTGTPVYSAGSYVTGHESPLTERWGGWYVTGTHGDQRHMGNALLKGRREPEDLDREAGANITSLAGRVATWPYLTEHSDIVALMVLEHQTQMQNLITRANYETRNALRYQVDLNKALGRPADTISESTQRRINSHAEKLVRYLLFVEEARLTAPIRGTSGFAADFARRGPRDRRGRSLRDFDLEHRLFKYPCSYLIDSEAFDGLPKPMKDRVYGRLLEILTGREQAAEFSHLTPDDRRAILEILVETKPDLTDDWARSVAREPSTPGATPGG